MSEMGQTETSARRCAMSVPPPVADIVRLHAQVRSVPLATIAFWVRASMARPHSWQSRTGGGAVHSIRSGRFDFMAPDIDVDQFVTGEMQYL